VARSARQFGGECLDKGRGDSYNSRVSNYGKCSSCGKWVPKGDKTCPHCDAEQSMAGAVAGFFKFLLPPPAPERKSGTLCVSCNKLVGVEDAECPHCGVRQTEVRKAIRAMSDMLPDQLTGTQGVLLFLGLLFALPIVSGGYGDDFTIGGYLGQGDKWTALRMGALHSLLIQEGRWWLVVTAGYLHFGILHLLFNGYALTILGRLVEDLYGTGWFLFIFVVTGVGAFVLSYLGHSGPVFTAGASGSIFGLIGLGIAFCLMNKGGNQALLRTLVTWTALSVVIGFAMPVDNWAHGGGFVTGAVMAYLLPPKLVTRGRGMNRLGNVLGGVSVLVVLGAFALNITQGGLG
jgi:membrane associated rhomboid family serine protease/RNA polymerase subunit RPABC4/transcription elongation factor Spt4